jgi:hypothetical protein
LVEALVVNRNPTFWAVAAIVLVATAACGASESFPVEHNEPIAVRVLDGKDGKPQANEHVVLVAGYDRRDLGMGLWREEVLTDSEGMVRLSNALTNLPLLRVQVIKRRACEADGAKAAFSVDRIRRDGLSAANRCGTAVAPDAPGVMTVFVKPTKKSAKGTGKVCQALAQVSPRQP